MQEQSRKCMTPRATPTYWYFERLRGQFLTDKALEGGVGTQKVKKFELARPQSQRFNKTDIAKIEMAWMKTPFIACKGAEVCFDKYWDSLQADMPTVDETYFKNLVAKMIIYNYIHRHLRDIGNKGYAAILCNYSLALLALCSQDKVDLAYIWNNQSLQPALKEVLQLFCKEISDYLTVLGANGSKNPQTESKKVDFWNNIQNKTLGISVPESVLVVAEEDVVISASQQADIDTSVAWGAENWHNLAAWTKKDGKNLLSIMEKKKIDHIAMAIGRGETPKARTAEDCQRIKRLAEDTEFNKMLKPYLRDFNEQLKDLYKALVEIGKIQGKNNTSIEDGMNGLKMANDAISRSSLQGNASEIVKELTEFNFTWMQNIRNEYNNKDFGYVFEKYINN